jgi:hypothetical protein
MPIMAAHGQNDARVAARLLVSTAVDCIRDPAMARDREVALNNVYRLLEAFRLNPFFGMEAPTRRAQQGAAEMLAVTPPLERHVKDVRQALDQAIAAAFAGQTKQQAIDVVEKVLRGVVYPQDYAQPSQEEKNHVARFFEEVLQRLKFA